MGYLYFAEDTHNDDSKIANYLILEDLDLHVYATGLGALRKYSVYDLSMLAEAPSISPASQEYLWGDNDYIYTVSAGTGEYGRVRKYQKADLTLMASSTHVPGSSAFGLWGDDTYIYELSYTSGVIRFLKSDLSYVDALYIPAITSGNWIDDEYLYVGSGGSGDGTLYKISLASFTIVGSVTITDRTIFSIYGDTNHLYIGTRNSSNNRVYLLKYWKSLEYITSTTTVMTTSSWVTIKVSLAGADYLVFSEDKTLRLYSSDDLSYIGSGLAFNYISSLCSDSDYTYVGSGWETGIYKYEIVQVTPTLITNECTERTATTLTANGEITDTGDENCTRRGFCYLQGTSGNPDIGDSIEYEDGDFGAGEYSLGLTGLDSGLPYRVRAYATSPVGTGYGNTVDSVVLSYPSDSVARVSSIRRIYRPGLYRMEVALGDLGFDVDVVEAAMKKITEGVSEISTMQALGYTPEQLEQMGKDYAAAYIQKLKEQQATTVYPYTYEQLKYGLQDCQKWGGCKGMTVEQYAAGLGVQVPPH